VITRDAGDGPQWPNERKPIFFTRPSSPTAPVSRGTSPPWRRIGRQKAEVDQLKPNSGGSTTTTAAAQTAKTGR